MLREIVGENTQVFFCGMECTIQEVLGDNRIKLDIPTVDGQLQLIPLYTQDVCRLVQEGQVFCARAEVMERYRSENRYVMELELKESLYRIAVQEKAVWDCREEGVLAIGEDPEDHLTVEVQRLWSHRLQFHLAQGQELTGTQVEEGEKSARITLWQMKLSGRLLTQKEGAGYILEFVELPWEIQKKITEIVLLEGKNIQNFGKK